MDDKKEDLTEELLTKLSEISQWRDSTYDSMYGDYSSVTPTLSIDDSWLYSNNIMSTNIIDTINTSSIYTTATNSLPMTVTPGGIMDLRGPSADILINGKSLTETLDEIKVRLNILSPNPALEKEWDQLRELGDAYRKLEAELIEKQQAWDILRKNPPSIKK